MKLLRSRAVLVSFVGAALTALGCSLIVEFDEARIPIEPSADVGADSALDTAMPPVDSGGGTDTAMGTDSAMPTDSAVGADTADSAMAADTADSAMAADTEMADTSAADTADSAPTDTGAADTADGGPTISFAADVQPIFNARCIGCHSGGGAPAGMSLASGVSHGNLVGVATTCTSTIKRVEPFSTTNSMLWRKTSNDSTKCGDAMPQGTAGLATIAPADFAKIEKWIQEGALNN